MLIGLTAYGGDAAAMRRQHLAAEGLLRLADVEAVNVQFRSRPPATLTGIETLPVLSQDSLLIAGPGRRCKAMTREVFDVLAETASARGHEQFCYINSDIVVLPAAIGTIARLSRQTLAISRHDVDSVDDLRGAAPLTAGIDMFVMSVAWWRRHANRFRPYVIGDGCWDNVYTAIMMCHSDGVVLNRDPLILHVRHETLWNDQTASARYNGFMAALDARYFNVWCQYWERLNLARRRGATPGEELELQEEMFVWRPSAAEAVRQSLRSVRAHWRFHRLRSLAAAP